MRAIVLAWALALGLHAVPVNAQYAKPSQEDQALIARGRYLVEIGNCNGCHTMGGAKTPEQDWLEGSRRGFHGPWGTTYPVNLRLLVGHMTKAQWFTLLHTAQPKPPMPWRSLQWMTPEDQQAVYAFIRHLKPAGKDAPGDLPPGVVPPPPVVLFPMPHAAARAPG